MIENGGWTPSGPWDHCAGGHPPQSVHEEPDGTHECGRCGRKVDKTPCGCGEPGHEALSRSFCPNRMREDKLAIRRAEWAKEQADVAPSTEA